MLLKHSYFKYMYVKAMGWKLHAKKNKQTEANYSKIDDGKKEILCYSYSVSATV